MNWCVRRKDLDALQAHGSAERLRVTSSISVASRLLDPIRCTRCDNALIRPNLPMHSSCDKPSATSSAGGLPSGPVKQTAEVGGLRLRGAAPIWACSLCMPQDKTSSTPLHLLFLTSSYVCLTKKFNHEGCVLHLNCFNLNFPERSVACSSSFCECRASSAATDSQGGQKRLREGLGRLGSQGGAVTERIGHPHRSAQLSKLH